MCKALLALFLYVSAAVSQRVFIGLPAQSQIVSAGGHLVVQVRRPNSLMGSEEVAVVIGLQSCPYGPCASPSSLMGTILYNGDFDPQYHEYWLPPYQNFTVQVPSSTPRGNASIGVAHVALIAAGMYPFLETLNQTITVV